MGAVDLTREQQPMPRYLETLGQIHVCVSVIVTVIDVMVSYERKLGKRQLAR